MKRLIFGLFTILTMGSESFAQVLTVQDVEALPGETVAFSVSMSEGKADTYTAMTLYAQFPATGFTTTGAYTVDPSWAGTSCIVGDVDGTGLATIPFASSNAIPGTAVDNLVTVSFTVDAGVAYGDYNVTLKETLFEYGTSDKDYAADVTFQVHVVSAHTVVLDENSTTAPEAATDVNVRVLRTITAGNWSTFCLPFAMSEAQVKAAFGNDVQLGDFTGYDAEYDGSDNVIGLTVNFDNVNAVEANHPYIIKVSSTITEFTVDGVTLAPEDNPSVSYGWTTGSGKNKVYHPKDFAGTYVADFDFYSDAASYPLFLSGNKFYYATGNSQHMKAFRGYFDFDDYLPEAESAVRMQIFVDGEGTRIEGLSTAETEGIIYDLNGRKATIPLHHGVYIVNGKKVLK